MQLFGAIWWRHNKFKMADGRHIEKSFFGYISAPYWQNYPISIKFGMQMRISISRMDIWTKVEILNIQDGV